MQYYVTITSQGQITIPSKLRREVGLTKGIKAIMSSEKGQAVIKPVPDILTLRGVFQSKKKPLTGKKLRKFLDNAWASSQI